MAVGSAVFTVSQLYSAADRINLQVDLHDLIDALNEAGVTAQYLYSSIFFLFFLSFSLFFYSWSAGMY